MAPSVEYAVKMVGGADTLTQEQIDFLKQIDHQAGLERLAHFQVGAGGKCEYRCGFCEECFRTSKAVNRHLMEDCKLAGILRPSRDTSVSRQRSRGVGFEMRIENMSDDDLHKKIYDVVGFMVPRNLQREKMIKILNVFGRIYREDIRKRELQLYLENALKMVVYQSHVAPVKGTSQESLIKKIQDLETELMKIKSQREKVSGEQEYTSQRLGLVQKDTSELQGKLNICEEKLRIATEARDQYKRQLEDIKSEKRDLIARLSRQGISGQILASGFAEEDSIKAKIDTVNQATEGMRNQVDVINRQIADLDTRIEGIERQIGKLTEEQEANKAKLSELQSKLADLSSRPALSNVITITVNSSEADKRAVASVQEANAQAEREKTQVISDLSSVKEAIAGTSGKISGLTTELAGVQRDRGVLVSRRDSLTRLLESIEGLKSALLSKFDELIASNKDLTQKLQTADSRCDADTAAVKSELDKTKRDLANTNEKNKAEKERLSEKAEGLGNALTQLEQRSKEQSKALEDAKSKAQSAREDANRTRSDSMKINREKDDAEKRASQSDSRAKALEGQVKSVKSENLSIRDALSNASLRSEELSITASQQAQEVAKFKGEFSDLKNRLDNAREDERALAKLITAECTKFIEFLFQEYTDDEYDALKNLNNVRKVAKGEDVPNREVMDIIFDYGNDLAFIWEDLTEHIHQKLEQPQKSTFKKIKSKLKKTVKSLVLRKKDDWSSALILKYIDCVGKELNLIYRVLQEKIAIKEFIKLRTQLEKDCNMIVQLIFAKWILGNYTEYKGLMKQKTMLSKSDIDKLSEYKTKLQYVSENKMNQVDLTTEIGKEYEDMLDKFIECINEELQKVNLKLENANLSSALETASKASSKAKSELESTKSKLSESESRRASAESQLSAMKSARSGGDMTKLRTELDECIAKKAELEEKNQALTRALESIDKGVMDTSSEIDNTIAGLKNVLITQSGGNDDPETRAIDLIEQLRIMKEKAINVMKGLDAQVSDLKNKLEACEIERDSLNDQLAKCLETLGESEGAKKVRSGLSPTQSGKTLPTTVSSGSTPSRPTTDKPTTAPSSGSAPARPTADKPTKPTAPKPTGGVPASPRDAPKPSPRSGTATPRGKSPVVLALELATSSQDANIVIGKIDGLIASNPKLSSILNRIKQLYELNIEINKLKERISKEEEAELRAQLKSARNQLEVLTGAEEESSTDETAQILALGQTATTEAEKSQIKLLKARITELEKQLGDTRSEKEQEELKLNARITELEGIKRSLQADIDSKEGQISALNSQIAGKDSEITLLQQQKTSATRQAGRKQPLLSSAVSQTLATTKQQYEESIKQYDEAIERVKRERNDCLSELSSVKNKLTEANRELAKVKAEVEPLKSQLKQCRDDLSKKRSNDSQELQKARGELDNLRNDISTVLGQINIVRSITLRSIEDKNNFNKTIDIYENDKGDTKSLTDQMEKLLKQIKEVIDLKTQLLNTINRNKFKLDELNEYKTIIEKYIQNPSPQRLDDFIQKKQYELKDINTQYGNVKKALYLDNKKVNNAESLLQQLNKDIITLKAKIGSRSKGGLPKSMKDIIDRIDQLNSIAQKEGASLITYGKTVYRLESEFKALRKELDDCKKENQNLKDNLAKCEREKTAGLGAKEAQLTGQIAALQTRLNDAKSLADRAMSKADEAFTNAGKTDQTEKARVQAEEAKRLAREAQLKAEADERKRKALAEAQRKEDLKKCNDQKNAIEAILNSLNQDRSKLTVSADKLNKYTGANKGFYTSFWRDFGEVSTKKKDCKDPVRDTSINTAQLGVAKGLKSRRSRMEQIVKEIIEETSQVGFKDCTEIKNQLQSIYDHLTQRIRLAKKIAESIQTKIIDIQRSDPVLAQKRFGYLHKSKGKSISAVSEIIGEYRQIASKNSNEISQAEGLLSQFKSLHGKVQGIKGTQQTRQQKDDLKQYENLCNAMRNLQRTLEGLRKNELNNNLINDFEDISGSVRVYVRINDKDISKPITTEKVSTYIEKESGSDRCSKTVIYKGGGACEIPIEGQKEYKGFYSVFMSATNPEIYNGITTELNGRNQICDLNADSSTGLKTTIDQTLNGYNVVLQVYGFSGSGKTYTLFGNDRDSGIVQLTFNDANFINQVRSIRITKIYELYGQGTLKAGLYPKINSQLSGDKRRMDIIKGGILDYNSTTIIPEDKRMIYNGRNKAQINSNIKEVIDRLSFYRRANGSVKSTPNNPESSRGHLFIEFSIQSGNKTGKLTVIDSGGIENPINIFNTYFPDSRGKSTYQFLPADDTYANYKQKIDRFTNNNQEFKDKYIAKFNKYKNAVKNNQLIVEEDGEKVNLTILIINILTRMRTILNEKYIYDQIDAKIGLQSKINELINANKSLIDKLKLYGLTDGKIQQYLRSLILLFNNDKVSEKEKFYLEFIKVEIFDILREGFYINESLNNMKYYFQFLQNEYPLVFNDSSLFNINSGKPNTVEFKKELNGITSLRTEKNYQYDEKKSFYLPHFNKDGKLLKMRFLDSGNKVVETSQDPIEMIDNLHKINKAGGDQNPSKFVLISLVKPDITEQKFCDGAQSALDFASLIASTKITSTTTTPASSTSIVPQPITPTSPKEDGKPPQTPRKPPPKPSR